MIEERSTEEALNNNASSSRTTLVFHDPYHIPVRCKHSLNKNGNIFQIAYWVTTLIFFPCICLLVNIEIAIVCLSAAALCILSGGEVPWDAKGLIHTHVGSSHDPDIFLINSRNTGGNRKFVCPCLEEFPQKKFVIKFPINSFEELLLRRVANAASAS